ncbi:DUF6273 domain-containing protein [Dysosmobacter welbionis]|uniref:DUF6273 domain-containing protein n=1 Tax=Dysosmobacter welbionis TaxID=2093857 RepID=UPI002941F252|nr:DUF6273 domain-containing protein [Dysosmobacter welbionis]
MAQTLGSVAVGSIVKIDENGSPVNYIVVHIGNPDVRLYGSACDGAWLLRQDIVENVQWNSTNANTLVGSTIMSTMAGYLGRYESHIQSAIKTVKIPYHPGNGWPLWDIKSGESGLECKLFPLCGYEAGLSGISGVMPIDGAKLDYFKSGLDTEANSKRIAKLNGAAAAWWLRSPVSTSTDGKFYVLPDGSLGSTSVNPSYGVLPAMIMDPTILVSDDGTVGVPASPTALTVPIQVMQGRQITVSWSAVDGVSSYILERKANTDADWVQVYSGANTSFEETVGTWTSVQYRVKSLANGKYGDYTTSTSVSVVPLSALVISGSDGSLGTLTNDVQYSVSSSGTSTLTVTETINGVNTRTYTATNGADNKISVVDLPTGTGTIKITASTNPGSGVVTVTREWTYTKAAITFPDAGSVADLTQQGKTIWAKTIAEAVRTPGIWGDNLGLALSKLAQAMLYDPSDSTFTDISGGAIPMVSIETGSYKGTGTSGSSNPNTLTFEFEPKALFIQEENDNYQALMLPGKTISYPFYNNGEDIMFPSRSYNRVAFSGSSVSWYCDGADSLATVQLNRSNVNYYYLVLG